MISDLLLLLPPMAMIIRMGMRMRMRMRIILTVMVVDDDDFCDRNDGSDGVVIAIMMRGGKGFADYDRVVFGR